jgi:predicted RNase H-like HicB family nuclease
MRYTFTYVIAEAEEGGFVGYIEELPGTHSQARTINDAKKQLKQAAELILKANRQFTRVPYASARVVDRGTLVLDDPPREGVGRRVSGKRRAQ